MMVSEKHKNLIVAGLADLAKTVDLEVLSLPIYTYNWQPGMPRAYTNFQGLYVSTFVLEHDVANIAAYICHELWHCIVEDPDTIFHLDQDKVGRAQDYKINQYMLQLNGYDIRKTKGGGLLDVDYFDKSIREIYKVLPTHGACYCGMTETSHPLLARQAEILRVRYAGVLEQKREYFWMDRVDSERFYDVMAANTKPLKLHTLRYIDANRTLKGVWAHICLDRAIAPPLDRDFLLPGELLAYAFPAKRYRDLLKSRPTESMLLASGYLRNVDDDDKWIKRRIRHLDNRIDNLKEKRHWLRKHMTREEVERNGGLIVSLTKRVNNLRKLTPLSILLAHNLSDTWPDKRVVKTLDFANNIDKQHEDEYRRNVKIPGFAQTDITRRLRACATRAFYDVERTMEILRDVDGLLKDFGKETLEDVE